MFSSVTSSVSSWLGATKPDDSQEEESVKDDKEKIPETKVEDTKDVKDSEQTENNEDPDIKHQIDEFGNKAVNTAMEWGSWLLDVGKTATTEVVKTAQTVKEKVEEKTILGDFNKEQEKFMSDQKEKKGKSEAAVPPWVGYNEEESMKQQIMALSKDQRNFLRNPPAGVQFHFDFEASFPVAMATLQEDVNLKKMRFDLVPKQIKENEFWRNYFYRVSLIKQSAQLTSLATQNGSNNDLRDKTSQDSKTESSEAKPVPNRLSETEPEDLPSNSPPENEFVSDAFQSDQVNEAELLQDMLQLGMSNQEEKEDIPEWERELQAELQEYEVVNEGADDDLDDAELEKEIMQQIEADASSAKE